MPTPIDTYLSGVPDKYKPVLEDLRKTIFEVIPEAQEVITYQIATFKYNGKAIIGFGAYKNHCSIFPFGGGVLSQFGDELKDFEQTKGSLHFTPEQIVPKSLIKKIIQSKLSSKK